MSAARTAGRLFYYVVRFFFRVVLTIYNRLSVRWLEELPRDGNVIVAGNHCSNLDPVVIGVAFPRQLRYFAKEELFRPFLFGNVIRVLGAIPVSRSDSASAAGALKGFLRLLEGGSDVLIFPEGGRSPEGRLMPLEEGVGLIASHSGVSILPVYVRGSHDAMPPGSALVRPKKLSVTFGRLIKITPELAKGRDARQKIVAALSESLHELEDRSLP
ncbi:MAG: 1-acyl-sn-glycerol-3-phosphate acyltransferase [Synergistaceae bacterium]|jgi:1-acyl-sn-glycerol-3-phosphate acyltransferase|nr:1-acyl-sn-glycerol-3-phosphate acyltransferase [Synergistaceae bacterium]